MSSGRFGYPYGRYALSARTTVWGVAGYGAGTLELTPAGRDAIETDLDLTLASAGLRGVVAEASAGGWLELAAVTDVMGVRTTSAAVAGSADAGGNLAAADVTRLRLGLEGAWRGLTIGTGTLVPRLELGLRHDGGDAETGFGLDLGGGLAWSYPGTGIRAEASARGLLTHAAGGFRDRGVAGVLVWDPRPGTERGFSLRLPDDAWPEFKGRVTTACRAPSRAIARDYAKEFSSAVRCFEDDFEACIAHLRMPINHRRAIRTTNLLERLFLEERRRLKVLPHALGERPVLKLMFAAMTRTSERWRAIRITDFGRRQMAAVRDDLDAEYQNHVGLADAPTASAHPERISSSPQT